MTIVHTCDNCGKSSPSLLRCSKCKSAWYCNRTCQSMAWNPSSSSNGNKDRHRRTCRRLQKAAAAMALETDPSLPLDIITSNNVIEAKEAWQELTGKVKNMDHKEAYQQMCLAQDEIEKLKKLQERPITHSQKESLAETPPQKDEAMRVNDMASSSDLNGTCNNSSGKKEQIQLNDGIFSPTTNQSLYTTEKHTPNNFMKRASGRWLDQGNKCSIEYLSNVQCYIITLTTATSTNDEMIFPKRKDDLYLTFPQTTNDFIGKGYSAQPSSLTCFEVQLYQKQNGDKGHGNTLLLSAFVPGKFNQQNYVFSQNARISIDANSISLRIQLDNYSNPFMAETDNMDVIGNLLGVENTSFAPTTNDCSELNFLRCRSCQNYIIDPPDVLNPNFEVVPDRNTSAQRQKCVIQSVLPLPSGYWDDIADYLSCYDGQAIVDFNSSTTHAIRRMALEDDAVLVLHKDDLIRGGVCTLGVAGYGEHSSSSDINKAGPEDDKANYSIQQTSSQSWKDKSVKVGGAINTVACANCCSTVGFVSEFDPDTYRLYKHLLDCGVHVGTSAFDSPFGKYTCGSFVAREMVRYAESEAIYTFIVGVSDTPNSTVSHDSGSCFLLKMLSWDTLMGVTNESNNGRLENHIESGLHFQKVLKVIFEEISDNAKLSNMGDDLMEWTWGGIDLCCLPQISQTKDNSSQQPAAAEGITPPSQHAKASSVRMFLSKEEWLQLRHALVCGSECFSGTVSSAVVMAKLGMSFNDKHKGQAASLSYLPLVN